MYLKHLALWGSLNSTPPTALPETCNIFANFPDYFPMFSQAPPNSFLNYSNECPYPVTVEIANLNDVLAAGFNTNGRKLYIAPFSPMRQWWICGGVGNAVSAEFVVSTSETKFVDFTCNESPITTIPEWYVEIPLSGSATQEFPLSRANTSIDTELINGVYVPYPVAEVFNGGYTTSTCITTTTTPKHKHLSAAPLWKYVMDYNLAIGLFPSGKHDKTSSSICEFEDIRADPDYESRFVAMTDLGYVIVSYWAPYLSTLATTGVFAFPDGQVDPSRRVYTEYVPSTPKIPTTEVFDIIATLWRDYQGLGDFGILYRGEDVIIQWTDLKISDDAVVSTQLTLHPNGDFKIRTGRCQGDDFGLLDGAVTGWQATDGSGQMLYKTFTPSDPCNIALDFEMNYQMRYVEQDVSDWFQPGDVDPFSTMMNNVVSAIEYGTIVPPPQGATQLFYDGVLYQGPAVWGLVQ